MFGFSPSSSVVCSFLFSHSLNCKLFRVGNEDCLAVCAKLNLFGINTACSRNLLCHSFGCAGGVNKQMMKDYRAALVTARVNFFAINTYLSVQLDYSETWLQLAQNDLTPRLQEPVETGRTGNPSVSPPSGLHGASQSTLAFAEF